MSVSSLQSFTYSYQHPGVWDDQIVKVVRTMSRNPRSINVYDTWLLHDDIVDVYSNGRTIEHEYNGKCSDKEVETCLEFATTYNGKDREWFGCKWSNIKLVEQKFI
jgi:hypothetical protein